MLNVIRVEMVRKLMSAGGGWWYESAVSEGVDLGQGVRVEFEDGQYPETLTLTIERRPEMVLGRDGRPLDAA